MYILSQIIKEQEAFWSHTRCQIYIVLPFMSFEVIWIQGSWLTGAHNGILGGHDLLMPVCPTQRNSIQSQRKKAETMLSASLFHWLCFSLWTYICVWVTVPTSVCVAVPTSMTILTLCMWIYTCICVCGCTYICVCVCDCMYRCVFACLPGCLPVWVSASHFCWFACISLSVILPVFLSVLSI